jgi:hypothetical protein
MLAAVVAAMYEYGLRARRFIRKLPPSFVVSA